GRSHNYQYLNIIINDAILKKRRFFKIHVFASMNMSL
uniref:Uncharacterized protein n=1 Tax=Amphimedon queenslandica TaxID=400682 RepID=A0A1X7V766_AMPQE